LLIAGAGIGGLTTALALTRQGHRVEILERAAELRPVGAGITVQINAMRVLARLGVAEAVAASGALMRLALLRTWDGAVLSRVDMGRMARELGAPCVALPRAELQRVLLSALGGVPLRLGAEVRGFREQADSVSAEMNDGTRVSAEGLIAADGLHSAIRAQLHGPLAPDYAGYTSWRGMCDNGGIVDPATASESWGAGRRFGLVPVGANLLYWFAVADAPPGARDGAGCKAELRACFAGWHSEVERALEATPREAILRTDIADRPALDRWGEGRVTLLGDAAHPMTPNLGQGACMAIEDAVVLARALGDAPELGTALRAYEEMRRTRTDRVVAQSRRFGRIAQWSNGLARAARNAIMRATPGVTERQLRWLYAFDASATE
jgi:2-polyprenyl-6-methoxyphenol hydroxylase-like FAD-dependent oxidoreductase